MPEVTANSLPAPLVDDLFPFHFSCNQQLHITHSGRSLRKLLPQLQPGAVLAEHLQLMTPHQPLSYTALRQQRQSIVIFHNTTGTIKLKGQLVELDGQYPQLLFVGTPVVDSLQNLQNLGLKLSDFAAHDATTDMLLLLQTQNLMNKDLQDLLAANSREIEQRRQVEQELRQAAADAEASSRTKASFLATMSHEIRTPLNAVLSTLSLLIDQADSPEQLRYLGIARDAGESLMELLDNILDYSKIDANKLDLELMPFSPGPLIDSVSALMKAKAQEKGLQFSAYTHAPTQLGTVVGDPGRIRQILLNLVSNAIKYTEQGSVILRCQITPPAPPQRHCHLRFEVSDTGLGIPAERIDELFSEFTMLDASYSRRYGGTGLGLVICKRLVELMQGRIGVDSEAGVGSRFWFEMELAEGEPAPQKPIAESTVDNTQSTPPCRILLAEDVMVNRMVLKQLLIKEGHRVDEAADGAEAIKAASEFTYDLILMDVSMPGTDGLEATRAIRQFSGAAAKVPIIALTAHAMRGDRETCMTAGMDDYLTKPVSRPQLLQAIAHWSRAQEKPQQENGDDFVDRAVLTQLGQDTDPAMVPELLKVFLSDARARLEQLRSAADSGDLDTLQAQAHALGSSAATFGLPAIHDLARSVEAAVRNDQAQQAQTTARQLLATGPGAFDALAAYAATLEAGS